MATKKQSEDGEERIISKILPDGTIIETIYDPVKNTTLFAISKDGKISFEFSVRLNSHQYIKPISAKDNMIVSEFVKLPSKVVDYGTPETLFTEIAEFVDRYMLLPKDFLTVSALYILLTWVYERFHTLPYIRVVGEFGTGKTRFLETLSALSYKSMTAGGSITTAALFRVVDRVRGTLVYDEADFRNTEMWSEIVKILNGGHSKGFAIVRTDISNKDDIKTQVFYAFGPKILASRQHFHDQALESRILTQALLPFDETKRPITLTDTFASEALQLRNKLLAFRLKNFHEIRADSSTVDSITVPRMKQVALALASIAKLINGKVLAEALSFLKNCEVDIRLNQKTDDTADLVLCIVECLCDKNIVERGKIYIREIADRFNAKFYNDYKTRETKYMGDGGFLEFPGQLVSARKIGARIQSLGFRKNRDSEGIYINIKDEIERIVRLVRRYGLEELVAKLDLDEEIKETLIKSSLF